MLYGIIGGVALLVIVLVVVLVVKSRKESAQEAAAPAEESYEDVGVKLVERAEPEPELTLVEEAAPVYAPAPEPAVEPPPAPQAAPEAAQVEISFEDDIADASAAEEAVEISLEIDAPADESLDADMPVEDMLAIEVPSDADAVEISLDHSDDTREVTLEASPEADSADEVKKKKEGGEGEFANEVDSEVDALFGDDF